MSHRARVAILASTAFVAAGISASPFVEWWSNLEARCENSTYPGTTSVQHSLAKLTAIPNAERLIPKDKTGMVEGVYLLHKKGSLRVLLATPTDRFRRDPNLKAEYFSPTHENALRACWDDKSWLIVQPGNVWTEIGLSPYCEQPYTPKEVDITVFDVPKEGVYVEFVTNAPATIPFELYQLVKTSFKLVRKEGSPGC